MPSISYLVIGSPLGRGGITSIEIVRATMSASVFGGTGVAGVVLSVVYSALGDHADQPYALWARSANPSVVAGRMPPSTYCRMSAPRLTMSPLTSSS